ncbi:hypothetical protein LAZ67_14001544 [Cordylochernes scorpioides]|uniref:MHC class I antigen n=1 Tax=Cordylochernes scorpioides TaxID=51811 RepID=A0ABY6L8P4_9ARAC|nr:hypothetical protein LAZ67_14001544 [Cordylochernes scorpioides]
MTRTDPEWKDKIITGDETWVYGYDPETKRQSAEWRGQDNQKRETGLAQPGGRSCRTTIPNCLKSPEVLTDGPQWSPLGMSLVSQAYMARARVVNVWREEKERTVPLDADCSSANKKELINI